LEEGPSTQKSQASTASTSTTPSTSPSDRQNEKLPISFPRPRPPAKPQDEDDDIGNYSRVQIIDTSFRIQKVRKSKALPGVQLTPQDLQDLESLAAYLATVYGLPEEDCLVILQESVPHLRLIVEEVRVASNSERPEMLADLKVLQREMDDALRGDPGEQSTLEQIEASDGMLDLETAARLMTDLHHKATAAMRNAGIVPYENRPGIAFSHHGATLMEAPVTYSSGAISLPQVQWDLFMPHSVTEPKSHSINPTASGWQDSQTSPFATASTLPDNLHFDQNETIKRH